MHSRFFRTWTDVDGGFELGPLPGADWALFAAAPGFVTEADRSREAGAFDLRPARTVSGRVVDEGNGVSGATVSAGSGCEVRTAVSDPDGSFDFDGLASFTSSLSARRGSQIAAVDLELDDGDQTDVVLDLAQGAMISGEVGEETGAPVAGVEVDCSSHGPSVERKTHTDGAGKFVLDALLPGKCSLYLKVPIGFLDYRRGDEVEVRRDQATKLSLKLTRGAPLTGRVVDESGNSVAGANIEARWRFESKDFLDGARTDEEGRFTLGHSPAGALSLAVEKKGLLTASRSASAPGHVDIVLKRGASIEVLVFEADGRPVPAANVSLSVREAGQPWQHYRAVASDAEGRWARSGLPSGQYRVTAQVPVSPLADSVGMIRHARTVAVDLTVASWVLPGHGARVGADSQWLHGRLEALVARMRLVEGRRSPPERAGVR
jgi:hypothetical protein